MWKNLKISTKIAASFGLVFILFGIAVVMGYTSLVKIVDRSAKSDDMQAIVKNILEARRHEKNLIIRGDAVYRDNTLKAIDAIKRQAQDTKERFRKAENKQLMDDVMSSTAEYEAAFRQLADAVLAGGAEKSALDAIDKKMVAAARKAQEACEAAMKDQKMEMAETVAAAKMNFIIFSSLALLLGGLAAFIISRGIVMSIRHVVEATRTVAEGNLAIAHLDDGANEMGQLGQSVNGMIANVSANVRGITATAAKVSVSAYRIHAVADRISNETAAMAVDTAHVSSSSKDMAATSESIAQSCQLSADGAKLASQSAQEGAAIVENTIKVMREIADTVQKTSSTVAVLGERSNQIGAIINTINDIADQTNLLALNAAIEAARAGEQGRGFAVVADEVRALSERTSKATREIDAMIKTIQTETRDAVAEMEQGMRQVEAGTVEAAHSGEALRNILDQVSAVAVQVGQIAAAAQGQTAATEEISQSIEAITKAMQATAEDARASAHGSSVMNSIAEELMAGIGKYKVEEDAMLAINKAKSAHMIFIGKIKSHLDGVAKVDANALPTHQTCAFGKWYQGKGQEACGSNSLFGAIDAPHAQVHALGKQAINAFNAGEKDKALALCAEMEANSMQLVDILNKLGDSISKN